MQKVILEITMSLDGFIAGEDVSKKNPIGKDGIILHDWIFKKKTDVDDSLLRELIENCGAVIVGSRTYETAIDVAWGGSSPFSVPVFVICHSIPNAKIDGFSFITEGIETALTKAKAIAADKNIWVMGGANVIQQYLNSNLCDELNIHVASVLLFEGTRLFDLTGSSKIQLRKKRVIDTPGATHLYYEIVK